MRTLALALLIIGCNPDIDTRLLSPEALVCGWVEAPQPAIPLDPLQPGECWRVRPETSDRASSTEGASACNVENGEAYYPGGSVIRLWYWAGTGAEKRTFRYSIVECP